ncbi:MAG: peptidoglycan DD-metalloendopeptidase family protein [Clostridium sp.]|nr:peptidoglycan DD-metalloendopeptidase family protein [Clostridium sp.]
MKRLVKRKKREYWSIMVVPHNTDEIKVFKISSLKYKLLTLGTVTLTFCVCLGLLITYLAITNRTLYEDRENIIAVNKQQKDLIMEKQETIESYIKKIDKQDELTRDFTNLYKNMATQYIDHQMEGLTATRSGGKRDDRAFINDINRLKNILDNLEQANDDDPEMVSELSETQAKLKEYIDAIPTLWPATGRISSEFGIRSDPFNHYIEKKHNGLDIAADYGCDIKASASGNVVFSDYYGNYGNCVIINHGYGLSTLYGHCSELCVKVGQSVKKGDVIAKVGSSGRSTGPHLHFEVRINDVPTDPLEYLDNN